MRLVFDCETNALDFSTGDFIKQVTDVWCIVAYDIDKNKWYQYPKDSGIMINPPPIITLLEEADELIGHNIIQFDIPVLRREFDFRPSGRIRDTLVESRLLYPDRPGGHSLKAWGERLGEQKDDFDNFGQYSEEMLRYCKRDVHVNSLLCGRLDKESSDGDWDRALALEHRIASIIAAQERRGFWFNKNKAEELLDEWHHRIRSNDLSVLSGIKPRVSVKRVVNRPYKINGDLTVAARKAASEVVLDESSIGGPFSTFSSTVPDLNSTKQQRELLLELGWKPRQRTPTGLAKIDESIIQLGGVGSQLHDRNILSHRVGLLEGLVNLTDTESRIHGGANPCGTNTSRMRHSRIVNIPRPSTPYGNEIRSLFGVPEGKCLVGYDAASLELRILAHYIGNPEYNERVTTKDKTQNAHTLAAEAAGSDSYDTGKRVNYALIFGAGDHKLGEIIGGTKSDGAALREHLYAAIPGFKEFTDRLTRAARKGYFLGLDGRKVYIRNSYQTVPTLIQSGGAVVMKVVTEHLDTLVGELPDTFKVIDMHDEAQWEVNPGEVNSLRQMIHTAFRYASEQLELTCPQEAEIIVGMNWAETH